MTAPLIALAGMHSTSVHGLRRDGVVAARRVVDALRRAGGEPVVLPPISRTEEAAAVLARFDGLVLPGGYDLDPARYGSSAPTSDDVDRAHDDADLALARAAVQIHTPLLAICRGMQVLNVALGGTLIEEVPPSEAAHRDGFHPVHLDPRCGIAQVMGTSTPTVSSYHHQAVAQTGEGLRVCGRASDGCIEALEHDTAAVLAVQWHPEDDAEHQPYEQALFDALVERSTAHLAASIVEGGAR